MTVGHAHAHPHAHSDFVHTHPHGHEAGSHGHEETRTPLSRLDRALGGIGLYQAVRPLVVGLVHGLAGSAAVALLVLATIRDPLWAVAYLFLFGLGTVVGMMLITAVIALPFAYSAGRFAIVNRYLGLAAGLLSLAVGLFLAYQIGLVDGSSRRARSGRRSDTRAPGVLGRPSAGELHELDQVAVRVEERGDLTAPVLCLRGGA